MNNQQSSSTEIARRAFTWRRSALHNIHHAIGHARRIPRTRIYVVPTGPERITWYECPRCGRPASLDGQRPPHCPLCGAHAIAHTWTRPDHEAPAPRPAHYQEVADAHPWMPLPDGEYRIMRKTRARG